MARIDTTWFKEQIARSRFKSQRRLAREIRGRQGRPLDPAALCLALSGERDLRLEEIEQLSKLLRVPVLDVLRHCGLRVSY